MLQLAEFIAERYKKVAEIGIGNYNAIAEYLVSKGVKVIATDIREVQTKADFFIDDVQNPQIQLYRGVELVYSIRPPPELFKSIRELANKLNADCIIKPLFGDYADGELVNYKGLRFYIWKRNGF
ncbi:MAG: UPF0146 family protein [Archaeoglobaceae archaeon]|nr:UPF0146 family protein [Archaeoglobaceae archaeon]MDW8118804.1 UPF0146 family protein [Archaeoglobaceae archaeon]